MFNLLEQAPLIPQSLRDSPQGQGPLDHFAANPHGTHRMQVSWIGGRENCQCAQKRCHQYTQSPLK